jgi:Glu-tRNA(Gln) amidotransferase subunit E-like FAD-binding protein
VENLATGLAEPPWSREDRYRAAGVPTHLIHYLIRRGGARVVDLVVEQCGADLRRACFFFGERIKSLHRQGLAVEAVPDRGWRELFDLLTHHPVLWQAWRDLTEWLVENPTDDLRTAAAAAGFGEPPDGWQEDASTLLDREPPDHATDPDGRFRFLMGRVMDDLRGRVPASEVEVVVRDAIRSPVVESPAG